MRGALLRRAALAACILLLGSLTMAANTKPPSLPQGYGLSAKYPGDKGLARDPSVLFAEDFEQGDLRDLSHRWEEMKDPHGRVMALAPGGPTASRGTTSLRMEATLGENDGGHLYRRLPREVDQLFLRFYVKFPKEAEYIHHFVHLGGYRPSTPHPQGGAGERPNGDERVTIGLEPTGQSGRYPAPGIWNLYCYWNEMKLSADEKYWGNGLTGPKPAVIPRDKWQCVEVMVKLNSAPEKRDGELAYWVEGKLQGWFHQGAPRGTWSGMGFQLLDTGGEPFEGFRWRTSADLKLNFVWLMHYVTENAARQNHVANPNPVNRVWFDDVVASTQYVGPIKPAAKAAPPKGSQKRK
jgi:hypothetical protein